MALFKLPPLPLSSAQESVAEQNRESGHSQEKLNFFEQLELKRKELNEPTTSVDPPIEMEPIMEPTQVPLMERTPPENSNAVPTAGPLNEATPDFELLKGSKAQEFQQISEELEKYKRLFETLGRDSGADMNSLKKAVKKTDKRVGLLEEKGKSTDKVVTDLRQEFLQFKGENAGRWEDLEKKVDANEASSQTFKEWVVNNLGVMRDTLATVKAAIAEVKKKLEDGFAKWNNMKERSEEAGTSQQSAVHQGDKRSGNREPENQRQQDAPQNLDPELSQGHDTGRLDQSMPSPLAPVSAAPSTSRITRSQRAPPVASKATEDSGECSKADGRQPARKRRRCRPDIPTFHMTLRDRKR